MFHAEFLLAHCLEQYLDVGVLELLHPWKAHFTTGGGVSSMGSPAETGSWVTSRISLKAALILALRSLS